MCLVDVVTRLVMDNIISNILSDILKESSLLIKREVLSPVLFFQIEV